MGSQTIQTYSKKYFQLVYLGGCIIWLFYIKRLLYEIDTAFSTFIFHNSHKETFNVTFLTAAQLCLYLVIKAELGRGMGSKFASRET